MALALGGALATTHATATDGDVQLESASEVELSVWERGPARKWRFRIVNRGAEPVRLATDPRLLWFDIRVPGKKKHERCRLPKALFPRKVDKEFAEVLKPGHAFAMDFDPRLYCFDAGAQRRLVPGSLLTPHFGWPEKTKTRWVKGKRSEVAVEEQEKPFAIAPTKKDSDLEPQKEIAGEPFALRSTYAAWASPHFKPPEDPDLNKDAKAEPPTTPSITLFRGSDARAERTATVTVSLENPTKRAIRVYFRRELLTFSIMGPDGLVTCQPPERKRNPDPQAFLRLRPGRKLRITSRLVELCQRGTFARPGLYVIHAQFDATESGDEFGYDAFTGQLETPRPTVVRIRTGTEPFRMRDADDRGKSRKARHGKHGKKGKRGKRGKKRRDGER